MTIVDASMTGRDRLQQPTSEDWDESRLLVALANLQATHVQLRHLRDTVPSLLRPMRSELSSPEVVYGSFAKAANGAVTNVREFAKTLQDGAVQDALSLAKKRRDEQPEGVMGWLVGQHEEWLNQPVTVGGNESIKQEEPRRSDSGVEVVQGDSTNSTQVIEAFEKAHPHIKIDNSVVSGQERIKIYLPPPTKVAFNIFNIHGNGSKDVYTASCEETGKKGAPSALYTGVSQALKSRPLPNNLRSILDMIAAYSNLKTQPCQTCKRLTDREGQFPVVRSTAKFTNTSTSDSVTWQPFHLRCVPP